MDALTLKAYEALLKNILPRLENKLQNLEVLDASERKCDDECSFLIKEYIELLLLMSKWARFNKDQFGLPQTVAIPDTVAGDYSDISDGGEGSPEAISNNPDPDLNGEHKDISDAEALRLMEEMEGSKEPSASKHDPEPQQAQEDMSDAEALRLMEEMEAGHSSSSSGQGEEDMSDDEAQRLLALMDSSSASAEPATQGDVSSPQQESSTDDEFADEKVEEVEEFGKSEFSSDPDMIRDFISNADELIERLDEQILALEQNPHEKEIINEIFRAAHTLKGAAGMFAFRAMERIMHRMENYFDQIAKGKQKVSSNAIDVILKSMDIIKTLLGGVKEGKVTGAKTAPIVNVLNKLCAGKLELQDETTQDDVKVMEEVSTKTKSKQQTQSTIRVDLRRLDALVNLVGELVIDRTRFSSIEEQLRTKGPNPQLAGNMTETVQLFGRHMNEVQDIIMKVRMVPIGNAFNKFSRVVRDLSKSLKKDIDLITDGEHTELDKTIVEQIGDPLIHLIRNSVDHGIEDPEARQARGKNPKGRILLSARQEGNQIMITIEDDGKGMDRDTIRQKAVEKGLIGEDENLSDRDIFNLIFEPGFSTAAQVTNISGRGVGMDVVKKQISKLKGVVDITSTPHVGTTISIQLPLTLAIVQSLLVKAQDEIFAIPLSAVVESIRITPKEIQNVGEAEVIKRRNRVLPLLYLQDALDLNQKEKRFWYGLPKEHDASVVKKRNANHLEDRLFVVVVGTAERRFGLVVDTLLNQQEMVIKSMGDLMIGIPCVAGGAILGNGEVVLVLDIGELEEHFRSKVRQQAA